MLKVDYNIDLDHVDKKPTRDGYGEGLVIAGENNESV